MKASKKQLRAQVKARLKALSSEQIEASSRLIWEKIEAMDHFAAAQNIALYWSMDSEVSTHEFVMRWAGEKNIFLPVVDGLAMNFVRFCGLENMSKNRFGIAEPAFSGKKEPLFDLIIVPGMGFDRQGHRLGHGGGFYDRYFDDRARQGRSPLLKVGVCLDCQILENVPKQEFDVEPDMVISPKEVIALDRNSL